MLKSVVRDCLLTGRQHLECQVCVVVCPVCLFVHASVCERALLSDLGPCVHRCVCCSLTCVCASAGVCGGCVQPG